MSRGRVSWRQKIEVRFEDDRYVVEGSSTFVVHDANIAYTLGNAHLFSVPAAATDIVVEEVVRTGSREDVLIGVYAINDRLHADILLHEGNVLKVFPKTKSFDDVVQFGLVLRYNVSWTRPAQERFGVDLSLEFFANDYLASIGAGEDEVLGELEILVQPPGGCEWDGDPATIGTAVNAGLRKLKSMDLAGTLGGLHVGKSIDINLRANAATPRLGRGMFATKLPVYQDAVTARAYVDKLEAGLSERKAEDVVVFVCDLRGSTAATENGRPSPDILRFHAIWRREPAGPFRLLKIIGDQILAVCDPSVFVRDSLPELSRAFERSIGLGLPIRGGLHFGKALPIGPRTESMVGSAVGEEFLGDAINHGAKIGDYKQNEGGLVASEEFLEWFRGNTGREPPATHWQDIQVGPVTFRLSRIDLGQLSGTTRRAPMVGASMAAISSFPDRMIRRATATKSRLVIGLDPDVYRFPTALRERWLRSPTQDTLQDIIFQFNKAIVEATGRLAVAFKPQIAFYEQYGEAGLRALGRTLSLLRDKDHITILDAKRNDIEHTAKAYADAWLAERVPFTDRQNEWRVDAITLNAYLGVEGVAPFLAVDSSAGVFLLAKTSNPSSADIQDLELRSGSKVFEEMARLAEEWGRADGVGNNGYHRIGLVVGATHPKAAEQVRAVAPSAIFLMPGVGAQGAPPQSIRAAGGVHGFGAYASSSRTVLYSFDEIGQKTAVEWEELVGVAATREATQLRDAINLEFAGN
jgi:orotidine-5'-phosphate decarboxylase